MLKKHSIYDHFLKVRDRKGAGYFILIDPDKLSENELRAILDVSESAGVDGILIGSSLMLSQRFNETTKMIRDNYSIPIALFPGSNIQLSEFADAVLFLSLISGRNSEFLIGTQVLGAPIVKKMGLEAISTGYMLIESGRTTAAEFMSNSKPIPRDKTDIAVAHALAGEMLGMKTIYLEAGSGAIHSVPEDMIENVSGYVNIPIIVGGGIKSPDEARKKVEAGASFVVTGNIMEKSENIGLVEAFCEAVHWKDHKAKVDFQRESVVDL